MISPEAGLSVSGVSLSLNVVLAVTKITARGDAAGPNQAEIPLRSMPTTPQVPWSCIGVP
jgi:hypothetical protein